MKQIPGILPVRKKKELGRKPQTNCRFSLLSLNMSTYLVWSCTLDDGNIMIAESGSARIIEVDRDGKIQKEIKLKVNNPHPHMDTRLARKIANGNYLVCHEGEQPRVLGLCPLGQRGQHVRPRLHPEAVTP